MMDQSLGSVTPCRQRLNEVPQYRYASEMEGQRWWLKQSVKLQVLQVFFAANTEDAEIIGIFGLPPI